MSFKGLTWDHPRGYQALQTSLDWQDCPVAQWDIQPLSGFEETPLEELADQYDLLVIDHPHLGQAVESQCLQPLDMLFSPMWLEELKTSCIGLSAQSYWYDSHCWALPLDASSQIMAYQKQAEDAVLGLGGWQDLIKGNLKYQLCLAGPHPTLQLLAMTLSLDPSLKSDALFIPEDEGVESLDLFKSVFKNSIEPSRVLNPIELLDTLSRSDSLDLCPFVYGYVNYSTESSNLCVTSPIGGESILGGTGIAITQRCTVNNDLLIYLKKLLSPNIQSAFIPNNGGQPSFQSAWSEANINQNSNDFYQNAFSTVNGAHLRPRHPGYTHFQDKAAHLIRHSLFHSEPSRYTIKKINQLYSKTKEPNHGTGTE
ncbi:membrane protein [Vibrio nigripulchritudo]|uniref:hypothetical protein n=1 Tax=Vibrio nigripulchritudo TaxID=28173 RepID=UPI001909C6E3|nr:hypothetical protein [Vibrio nigripulchritudo]BCL68783.1 membrane protein [Vibrio nigripulchritudo]BDU30114.1 membrane protein [Vibrio nigripulchritudo]